MKTKRRLIIREYDLNKLPKHFTDRYDIKFTPFTRDWFEKRVTYYSLKGKGYLARQYLHYDYPESLLKRMTGFKFHDRNYPHWLCKYDDEGQLKIRAGLKQPESRLGFATLKEKQYDTVD
jgi:hypothetical protein